MPFLNYRNGFYFLCLVAGAELALLLFRASIEPSPLDPQRHAEPAVRQNLSAEASAPILKHRSVESAPANGKAETKPTPLEAYRTLQSLDPSALPIDAFDPTNLQLSADLSNLFQLTPQQISAVEQLIAKTQKQVFALIRDHLESAKLEDGSIIARYGGNPSATENLELQFWTSLGNTIGKENAEFTRSLGENSHSLGHPLADFGKGIMTFDIRPEVKDGQTTWICDIEQKWEGRGSSSMEMPVKTLDLQHQPFQMLKAVLPPQDIAYLETQLRENAASKPAN